MSKRICVFGLGAIGGHLAAKLAHAGHELCVVARGQTLEAVRDTGLTLESSDAPIHVFPRVSADPAELGPQDLVFVTVKATGLVAAARQLAPLVGAGTLVVFVQNGIPWWFGKGLAGAPDLGSLDPEGKLAALWAGNHVAGGVVTSPNMVVSPGVVRSASKTNLLSVGEIGDGQSERIGALRALLSEAGLQSPPTSDLRKVVWQKLMMNMASSPLCTLTRRDVRVNTQDPEIGELFEKLVREGLAIADAYGTRFSPEELNVAALRAGGGSSHKPSMLQDFEAGRPLETEAILRMPQRFARHAGVATPVLDTVLPLLERLAADR